MRRIFFWGGSEEKARMNWVAWEKVIAPVEYGGVGLGSLKDANNALLAKWWWRFTVEQSNLWRKLIWSIHNTSRDWNFIPVRLSLPGPWKHISKAVAALGSEGVNVPMLICSLEEFSVRKVKYLIMDSKHSRPAKRFVWNHWVPKKVVMLAWRASLNRIPTLDSLSRRGINIPSLLCPICGDLPESVDHIFIGCGLAQNLWSAVSTWLKIPPIFAFSFQEILDIPNSCHGSPKWKKAVYGVILVVLWCVWRSRNGVVFKGEQVNIHRCMGEIKSLSFLWIKNRAKQPSIDWESWCRFDLRKAGW